MDPKLGTDFNNGTKGSRLGDFEVGQENLILFCLDLQKAWMRMILTLGLIKNRSVKPQIRS